MVVVVVVVGVVGVVVVVFGIVGVVVVVVVAVENVAVNGCVVIEDEVSFFVVSVLLVWNDI